MQLTHRTVAAVSALGALTLGASGASGAAGCGDDEPGGRPERPSASSLNAGPLR
jgi:hypothetical protein